MDGLDSSLSPKLTVMAHSPAECPRTLTRCKFCSTSVQPSELSDLSGNSSGSDQVQAAIEPFPLGTGVYFRQVCPSRNLESSADYNEFRNLCLLATVACEIEKSPTHHQLMKKPRTPRTLAFGQGSRFVNENTGTELPAIASKRQRITNISSAPWPGTLDTPMKVASLHEKAHDLRSSTLSLGPQKHTAGDKPRAIVNVAWHSKGKRLPATYATKVVKTCANKIAGQETRVESFAKKVLQFVGESSIAEKFIRSALGNNPDTSKALRLLLRQQKVCRLGDGGRGKAFLYLATAAGLKELKEVEDENVERRS